MAEPKNYKMASEVKYSAEAFAKRAARALRRQGQTSSRKVLQKDCEQDEESDSMWENTYAFSSFKLSVQEEFGGESCVGGTQWPGGVRVARYLDNPKVFPSGALKGKTLLDLGSGCGLVAAVAAKHGARVVAAEKDIVIPLLKENLTTNGVLLDHGASKTSEENTSHASLPSSLPSNSPLEEGKVVVHEFYWGPDARHPLAPFDLIIAAACLYMPKTVPLLLHTLWNVSDSQSLILLCSILGADTLQTFKEEVGGFFHIRALDETNGNVIGTSSDDNLSSIDVATRILILERKRQSG